MKKNKYLLFAALAAMLAAGCSEPKGLEPDNSGKVRSIGIKEATYVSASRSMQLTMKDNAELQVTVYTIPANSPVKFSNLHPELLNVSETGLLKGVKPGTDTLFVSATDGSGLSTRYIVNVTDHLVKATAINVAAAGANFEMKFGGKTFNLGQYVTLAPADTWDKNVSYTSNDTDIVTVDQNGIVTSRMEEPSEPMSTTITIKTLDGSNLSKDVNVKVVGLISVYTDLARTGWTAYTITDGDYGYMWDGNSPNNTQASHATGLPEHLFDGQRGSFLNLLKNGLTYNSIPGGTTPPAFVVDMKSAQKFNYIKWAHRNGNYTNPANQATVSGNNSMGMRVIGVYLWGSNDGNDFTPIAPETPAGDDGMVVWIPNITPYNATGNPGTADDSFYNIPVKESNYRYIKAQLVAYRGSSAANTTYAPGMYQHPDYPGTGSGNSCLQVSEFGAGNMVIE